MVEVSLDVELMLLSLVLLISTALLFYKSSSVLRDKFKGESSANTSGDSPDGDEPSSMPSGPAKSVLIVDDDKMTRMQLGSRLKRLDFQCIEVSDGASAVALFEKGVRFALVVMDYEMPDMNGVLAIKKIREIDPDVVIVGSTVHDPALMQQDFLKAGANFVDIKPIGMDALCEVISEYNLN